MTEPVLYSKTVGIWNRNMSICGWLSAGLIFFC
jgi:hypothetical protein